MTYQRTGGLQSAIQQLLPAAAVNLAAATYTVLPNDQAITCGFAGTMTLTLPDAATNAGRWLIVRTIANQFVNASAAVVVPFIGGAPSTSILTATLGKFALMVSDGTYWQIMAAN